MLPKMSANFPESNFRFFGTSVHFRCLVILLVAGVSNAEVSSICATSPALQILRGSIHSYDCEVNETIHALNCSGQFIPALPRTDDPSVHIGTKIFDFSHNKIKCLPKINNTDWRCDVQDCSKGCLLALHLQDNEIDYLPDDVFLNLTCLEYLDLSNNQLTSQALNKQQFAKQAKLLHLDLHGNPLGDLPYDKLVFTYLPHLQWLNLSSCHLISLGHDSLGDFFELEVLDLSFNNLKDLLPTTFKGLGHLKTLDLSYNQVEVIVADTFASMVSLRTLRLSNNNLRSISGQAFSTQPPPVEFLDLTFNQFNELPLTDLRALTELRTLDVSYNRLLERLRASPDQVYTTVTRLRLDYLENLKKVDDDAFSACPSLTHVSLSHAKRLSGMATHSFRGSTANITFVRMENNGFSSLPKELLPWKQLSHLSLMGNPWYCDCFMAWAVGYHLGNTSSSCAGPLKMKGQLLSSLTPDELNCPKPLLGAQVVIAISIAAAAVVVIVVVLWNKRRRLPCKCLRGTSGRYVTVFTKERPIADEIDSGNGSCADGEIDDLDLDLGTPRRSIDKEEGPRSEGGAVMILLNTVRNSYRRLAQKDTESTQDLTLDTSLSPQ